MKIVHYERVESAPVEVEGAVGCTIRLLIDQSDGAPNFDMRRFEVAPGGYTPKHTHAHEHEVYVLEGSGVVLEGDEQRPLRAGVTVYVAPWESHQFRNTGTTPLEFLCLIPRI